MPDFQRLAEDLEGFPNCIAPEADTAIAAGAVIRPTGNNLCGLAEADSDPHAALVAVAIRPTAVGDRCVARYVGPVTLTAAQWDAIAGTSGGLTAGTVYYLSRVTAGHIVAGAPGVIDVIIGVAISTTTLMVNPVLSGAS